MDEYIKNLAAVRSNDGNILISWVWPSGYTCVRIVFLHRLAGRDIRKLSADELGNVSDLCFLDEFQIAGGKYVYPIGSKDTGMLKFRVYCCESPDKTEFDKCSADVGITGITLDLRYKSVFKKSGKNFKKVTFSINSEADIPPGSLAYRVMPAGMLYPINAALPAGSSDVGQIIIGAAEDCVLELAPGHEGEFRIHEG